LRGAEPWRPIDRRLDSSKIDSSSIALRFCPRSVPCSHARARPRPRVCRSTHNLCLRHHVTKTESKRTSRSIRMKPRTVPPVCGLLRGASLPAVRLLSRTRRHVTTPHALCRARGAGSVCGLISRALPSIPVGGASSFAWASTPLARCVRVAGEGHVVASSSQTNHQRAHASPHTNTYTCTCLPNQTGKMRPRRNVCTEAPPRLLRSCLSTTPA